MTFVPVVPRHYSDIDISKMDAVTQEHLYYLMLGTCFLALFICIIVLIIECIKEKRQRRIKIDRFNERKRY